MRPESNTVPKARYLACILFLAGCASSDPVEVREEASTGGERESTRTPAPAPAGRSLPTGVRTRALILSDADPEAEAIIERQAFRLRVRDSDDRVIAPGATMRTGERFYVEIAPVRPVYVYMMYRGPDGRSLPLYPGEHRPPVRLEAGTWTRVPQRQYIELDEQVGEEQLYVFVSERSFSDLPAADSTQQAVAAAQAGRELPTPRADEDEDLPLYSAQAVVAVADVQRGILVNPSDHEDPPRARRQSSARQQGSARPRVRMRGYALAEPNDELVVAPDMEGVSVILFPITHVAR